MRVPRPHRPRTRTIVYLVACLLAGGGLSVAGASVLFAGSLTGLATGAPDQPGIFYSSTGLVATPDQSGVSCSQTLGLPSAGVTGYYQNDEVLFNNAYPGSTCTFTVNVIVQGSTAGAVLQSIQVVELTTGTGGSGGTGFTAALGKSCGKAISTNPASPTTITFTVTTPTGSDYVQGGSMGLNGELQAVPTGSYTSSACT
jgi:hypothetical protein